MLSRSSRFIISLVLLLSLTVSVSAQVTHTGVAESQFGGMEFKTLLTVPGVTGKDSAAEIAKKVNAAIKGIKVTGPSGMNYAAYFDTESRDLRNSGYILRVKKYPSNPGKVKITLKGRWKDVTKAGILKGAGISPSKLEIDVSGGKKIYAISYKVKVDGRTYFPGGNVSGDALMNGIEARYEGLGKFLRSKIGGKSIAAPGFASLYGASAYVEPGILKTAPGGLNMGMDIFKIGEQAVVLELSFKRSSDGRKQGMAIYNELGALLKKQGLISAKQATKTASYLDHFQKK